MACPTISAFQCIFACPPLASKLLTTDIPSCSSRDRPFLNAMRRLALLVNHREPPPPPVVLAVHAAYHALRPRSDQKDCLDDASFVLRRIANLIGTQAAALSIQHIIICPACNGPTLVDVSSEHAVHRGNIRKMHTTFDLCIPVTAALAVDLQDVINCSRATHLEEFTCPLCLHKVCT